MKICKHCSKEFSKFADINKHENACWNNPSNRCYCKCCGDIIKRMPGSMFDGKYCSQSCAAKITNSNREVTWGEKTRKTIMEYFENNTDFYKTDWKDYKAYRKKVDRYSIQQLKDKKPKLYKYWQSNPYKNDGDTSKLSLEHITPVKYYYDNKLSIQEAGDISNLEIIPYYENHRRQQEYKTFEKSI